MYQSCCCAVKKQRREGRAYRHALSVRKGFKVAKSQGFKDPNAEPLSLPTGKPYNVYTATFETLKPCNFENLTVARRLDYQVGDGRNRGRTCFCDHAGGQTPPG